MSIDYGREPEVHCDGCSKMLPDGEAVYCPRCHAAPDAKPSMRDAADALMAFVTAHRRDFTTAELDLLEDVADGMVTGRLGVRT